MIPVDKNFQHKLYKNMMSSQKKGEHIKKDMKAAITTDILKELK